MKYFFILAWVVFSFVFLSGGKTHILSCILIPSTIVYFIRNKQAWNSVTASRRIPKIIFSLFVLMVAAQISALLFDYWALNGTLWDLTMYIQEIYRLSTLGTPTATFPGNIVNHLNTHRSLSLFVLGKIFGFFPFPELPLIWEGFFLFCPAIVLGYLFQSRSQTKRDWGGFALATMIYALSPMVLLQGVWPYVFYIAGFSLLALGYYFFSKENWLLWTITLCALAFEKEDFGVISAGFGITALLDVLFIKKWSLSKIVGAVILIVIGIGSPLLFHRQSASVVTFASRFGELGATPELALKNLLNHPLLFFQIMFRPSVLQYWGSILLFSTIWFKPRWEWTRFFMPIVPLLLANSLASYEVMRQFKDPYSLPIAVGLAATIICRITLQNINAKPYIYIFALLPLLWPHQTPFRTLKESYGLWKDRAQERALVEELRNDRNTVICCADRLCSRIADRPLLLELKQCENGTALLKGVSTVVFLDYEDSETMPQESHVGKRALPYSLRPRTWKTITPLLKVSDPVPVLNHSTSG